MEKNLPRKEVIVTFANFGNYTVAFKSLFEKLGMKVIPPSPPTQETNVRGAKISPEMFCFPMKVTLGNYIEPLKKGANTIFMVQNVGGSCRQRYYGNVQEKVLKEAGYKVNFLNFKTTPQEIYKAIKKISGASFFEILNALLFFFKKLKFIEKIEKFAQYLRPREIEKGKTDEILKWAFLKIEETKESYEIKKLKTEVLKKLRQIKIEKKKEFPRIGIIGEIYTVCNPYINFGIEKKLGQAGIEVHREMDITYHLKKLIFPWKDWQIQRKINPYLKSTVGGHGRDAIYEMLNYIKKNFDGIIHLLPFGCFIKGTNITVEKYLQKPIEDIKIGEKVLTHRGRFKRVTKTFSHHYQGPILKINCGGKLLTISVTPEHPLLLAKDFIKNHKKRIQDLKFTPAYQTKKGDFIAIPKVVGNRNFLKWNKEYQRKPKWEDIKIFPYSSDLLRMLGYWLAKGHLQIDQNRCNSNKKYKRGLVFSFSHYEQEYIQDVINIVKRNFKTKISQYYFPKKPLYIGNRNSAEIISCLSASYCDKKILYPDLVNLEPNLQKELLKGFLRDDGNFRDEHGETTYRGVSTSWNLASQLFWFLIRNRIKPSFMEQNIKNKKPSYMLKTATGHEIKRLEDEKIKVTKKRPFVKHRELKDYFLVPIRKIEWFNFKGKVYNLEVEEDHSYLANFLAVHNCMPEVTVRPILEKIHQNYGIPFLSLSLDEEVAEAGVNTRLEAFIDIVKNYYQSKNNKKGQVR